MESRDQPKPIFLWGTDGFLSDISRIEPLRRQIKETLFQISIYIIWRCGKLKIEWKRVFKFWLSMTHLCILQGVQTQTRSMVTDSFHSRLGAVTAPKRSNTDLYLVLSNPLRRSVLRDCATLCVFLIFLPFLPRVPRFVWSSTWGKWLWQAHYHSPTPKQER